jgi:sugar phosphate isomerase/epimerase
MDMKLSVVTDEISADLETALELAQNWGLAGVELRGIGGVRYPEVSPFWQARVPELVQESGLPVVALSPGLFKIPFPTTPAAATRILRWEDEMVFRRFRSAEDLMRHHLEVLLPASITAARLLGTPTIVAFTFDRGETVPPEAPVPPGVIAVLQEAARQVEAAGLTLALEVEHICWGDTGERTARLVEKIGSSAVGINWDPANAYRAGSDHPYPDGYQAVRELIRHVHYKDAATDPETGNRGFVYDGVVDWRGQIKALLQDGYQGYMSIETHVRPKIEMARRSIERVRAYMEAA